MKLYELTTSYNTLLDLDIPEEELKPHLDILDNEIEVKAENIAKVIRNLDAEAKAYKEEADRLIEKKRTLESRSKNLKSYLENQMLMVDKKKFKSGLFSFSIQKNPASLKVINEDKVPEKYWIVDKRIDNTQLKKDLKENIEDFEGIVTLTQSESLRIR